MNIESGEKQLLVSFDQLADVLREKDPDIDAKELFINHTLSNRDSDRIFFFVRADFDSRDKKLNEPFPSSGKGVSLLDPTPILC